MSTITVRLFHHPSRTPIAELQGVDPGASLSSLRAMAERHLAAEEACMMRVFDKWHIEVQLGARKAVVELTAQDGAASLSSLGIEDYSAVLLAGPLTGDFEGVGQAVSLVAAQMREQNSQLLAVMSRFADMRELKEQNAEIKGILLRIAEGISGMSADMSVLVLGQQRDALPSFEYMERLSVAAEEQKSLAPLSLQSAAVAGYFAVAVEEAHERVELLAAKRSEYQRLLPFLAIDTTTPQPDVVLEDQNTAVKTTSKYWVTLRSSQPLSEINHRWAVRVHKASCQMDIYLGLLPKLPEEKEARMGDGVVIHSLGGWCIYQGDSLSYVYGDWQCEPLPFAKGDLVLFDYSFADKTLTIRCGGKHVVGRIPNMKDGEELYPAFSFAYTGARVSFEKYQ